jgi:hypothetical protein
MRWQLAFGGRAMLVVAALAAGTGFGPAAAVDLATGPAPGLRTAEPLEPSVAVGAVHTLLYARRFRLQEPYTYSYLRDRPAIREGYLLVLAVDPEMARPREVDGAVLYAGDTPAHLTNTGYPSGRMVLIVPDWFELSESPVFFGSTELPERIDRARGSQERKLAVERGARPFPPEVRDAAVSAGGDRLECRNSVGLFLAVADLIERFAPDESERADLYRTPLVEP